MLCAMYQVMPTRSRHVTRLNDKTTSSGVERVKIGFFESHDFIFMHWIHEEHLIEFDDFLVLQRFEHGTQSVTVMLLALFYQHLWGKERR